MPNERENKPFQFEPFAIQPWSGMMGQAVTDLPGKFCDSGFSATRGYLDFLSQRTRADLELAAALPRCRTPVEFWQTLPGFWLRAANDYQREFVELGNRWRSMTSENAEAITSYAERARAGQKLAA
jgi:hypothetical protein